MKRREFLRGAAAGVLGGLGLTLAACGQPPAVTNPPTSAPAQPTAAGGEQPTAAATTAPAPATQAPAQGSSMPAVEWRMGTSWPIALDTIYGGATVLAERVAELSNGMFKITTFPAGELFPGLEVLQNVSQGTVESGHTALYYYVGLDPAWAFATSLPFGLTAQQQNSWLYHGGGEQAVNKLGENFGVISFAAGNTGTQMGGWFRREINTVADMQGLKMRIPGLGAQVMLRLGVVTQTLPGGEIFQALSTGAIDAAEWVGPYDDEKLGLPDAAEFYYAPGWWEPGPSLHAVFNLDAWNKLPKEYQNFLRVAAWESNMNMLAKYDALNNDALERIVAKGKQLRVYSDEILSAAQKAAFELYAEYESSSAAFREILPGWNAFRQKIQRWHQTNELPFNNFVKNNPV
ncbi:MAG TPA: ABC transporter substrate-binding protein [Chloroflexus aurantiacus]|uniref:TRAP dicarboxylate transporter-DctP subunit n=1 Tax=Chloroflexus aurantiacus (strain ATCC 29366 / DSM 635 / J-10-fl) TaxID=324602 RepID=A9WGK5_CHLAA|nr:TRAP transporter substrate-binding protein [Chloroflexus aurantiacus]ABY35537.1 TRAP dicarboxylate transporter- DctP subunit [Chloroflexus aurantiacus J-10-fl]RMG50141.1 MAG: ABC transporter substrate-binding protein [Chloroflexota bacterium]GIV92014.1 MAG: C4-dicarboxylate ABC transporter [Chloroflexus sp.]HBW69492.1 ABC transporter substrate-binding protein [Chloroflexus aurantiacus]